MSNNVQKPFSSFDVKGLIIRTFVFICEILKLNLNTDCRSRTRQSVSVINIERRDLSYSVVSNVQVQRSQNDTKPKGGVG